MRPDRRWRRTAVTLVVTAALGACGNGTAGQAQSPPTPAAALTFGPADVDFAVALSQHHGQALQMTDLAQTRARSAAVKNLATEIAAAYAPQIDAIGTWITTWVAAGAELPPHGIGHDEAGPGMLATTAVDGLEKLKGRAFDRQFARLMTRHHRGGIGLVERELAGGINPDARAVAEQLRLSQTRQLDALRLPDGDPERKDKQ